MIRTISMTLPGRVTGLVRVLPMSRPTLDALSQLMSERGPMAALLRG
jgi:hypothetical protein